MPWARPSALRRRRAADRAACNQTDHARRSGGRVRLTERRNLLWCRCEDHAKIECRLSLRRGRESEPECEASDWSVFEHLARCWEAPSEEWCGSVPVLSYDTRRGRLQWLRRASRPLSALIENALGHGDLDGQGHDATHLGREPGQVDRWQVPCHDRRCTTGFLSLVASSRTTIPCERVIPEETGETL